jgi:hypothetical protein
MSGAASQRLIHGTILVTSQPQTFVTPNGGHISVTVAAMRTTEGCSQAGDSGGPWIAGDHSVIAVQSGHLQDGAYCWLFGSRAGDAMAAANQVPAPLP